MSQTPDEINNGQRQINYELVQIDRKIIETLNALIDILKSAHGLSLDPRAASRLAQIDLNSLETAISRACSVNEVGAINPPGTSKQNSESFLKVARSLNLEGPPDWSSRLDDYLYGDNQRIDE